MRLRLPPGCCLITDGDVAVFACYLRDLCVTEEVVPVFCHTIPLIHCAEVGHTRKVRALKERIAFDARHAVGNRHAREACAIEERIQPDGIHAVAYFHARKARAIRERAVPDARNAVGNRHA